MIAAVALVVPGGAKRAVPERGVRWQSGGGSEPRFSGLYHQQRTAQFIQCVENSVKDQLVSANDRHLIRQTRDDHSGVSS